MAIPLVAETKMRCPKCNSALQHFGNTTRCSQCAWQPNVPYSGRVCENGCDPKLIVAFGHGHARHCNGCGRTWG